MQSKIVWLIIKHYKKMWVRVISFAVLALVTAIMSQWFGRFFPDDWSVKIGADAVGNVLNILASSMLAVTTFSLGIAVSAFSAAASNATQSHRFTARRCHRPKRIGYLFGGVLV